MTTNTCYAAPDTELTDACRACGTAGHSIQNCPAIRAEMRGGRIKANWDGVVFFDPIGIDGMTLTEALTNHAEHNDEHEAGPLCHCDYCQVWIPMAHKVESDSTKKDATIAALRLALDEAHQHVGALEARNADMERHINECNPQVWEEFEGECPPGHKYECGRCFDLRAWLAARSAALTWLRRA